VKKRWKKERGKEYPSKIIKHFTIIGLDFRPYHALLLFFALF